MVSGTEVCRIVWFCVLLWIVGPIVRVINGAWVLIVAATAGTAWMIGERRRVGGRRRRRRLTPRPPLPLPPNGAGLGRGGEGGRHRRERGPASPGTTVRERGPASHEGPVA